MIREMHIRLKKNVLYLVIILLLVSIALLAQKWDLLRSTETARFGEAADIPRLMKNEIRVDSSDLDSTSIEVVLIFRHGSLLIDLQDKFKVAVGSLLQHTSSLLTLHIVTEADSYKLATSIIAELPTSLTKSLKVSNLFPLLFVKNSCFSQHFDETYLGLFRLVCKPS